jgi:hypothetical protein
VRRHFECHAVESGDLVRTAAVGSAYVVKDEGWLRIVHVLIAPWIERRHTPPSGCLSGGISTTDIHLSVAVA